MKHRLYVDEVGNPDLGASEDPNRRYLSLTGAILQLADVIAHPSLQATLARRMGRALPENFGGEIARILEKSKSYRSPSGQIEGWGRKWLP
jgi:hypothetical protein